MNNRNNLEQIKNLSNEEKRNIKHQELIDIMQKMTTEEIIELSKIIGYPVFARLCMGELNHKFVFFMYKDLLKNSINLLVFIFFSSLFFVCIKSFFSSSILSSIAYHISHILLYISIFYKML